MCALFQIPKKMHFMNILLFSYQLRIVEIIYMSKIGKLSQSQTRGLTCKNY